MKIRSKFVWDVLPKAQPIVEWSHAVSILRRTADNDELDEKDLSEALLVILKLCGDMTAQMSILEVFLQLPHVCEFGDTWSAEWFSDMPRTMEKFNVLFPKFDCQHAKRLFYREFLNVFNSEMRNSADVYDSRTVTSIPVIRGTWNGSELRAPYLETLWLDINSEGRPSFSIFVEKGTFPPKEGNTSSLGCGISTIVIPQDDIGNLSIASLTPSSGSSLMEFTVATCSSLSHHLELLIEPKYKSLLTNTLAEYGVNVFEKELGSELPVVAPQATLLNNNKLFSNSHVDYIVKSNVILQEPHSSISRTQDTQHKPRIANKLGKRKEIVQEEECQTYKKHDQQDKLCIVKREVEAPILSSTKARKKGRLVIRSHGTGVMTRSATSRQSISEGGCVAHKKVKTERHTLKQAPEKVRMNLPSGEVEAVTNMLCTSGEVACTSYDSSKFTIVPEPPTVCVGNIKAQSERLNEVCAVLQTLQERKTESSQSKVPSAGKVMQQSCGKNPSFIPQSRVLCADTVKQQLSEINLLNKAPSPEKRTASSPKCEVLCGSTVNIQPAGKNASNLTQSPEDDVEFLKVDSGGQQLSVQVNSTSQLAQHGLYAEVQQTPPEEPTTIPPLPYAEFLGAKQDLVSLEDNTSCTPLSPHRYEGVDSQEPAKLTFVTDVDMVFEGKSSSTIGGNITIHAAKQDLVSLQNNTLGIPLLLQHENQCDGVDFQEHTEEELNSDVEVVFEGKSLSVLGQTFLTRAEKQDLASSENYPVGPPLLPQHENVCVGLQSQENPQLKPVTHVEMVHEGKLCSGLGGNFPCNGLSDNTISNFSAQMPPVPMPLGVPLRKGFKCAMERTRSPSRTFQNLVTDLQIPNIICAGGTGLESEEMKLVKEVLHPNSDILTGKLLSKDAVGHHTCAEGNELSREDVSEAASGQSICGDLSQAIVEVCESGTVSIKV